MFFYARVKSLTESLASNMHFTHDHERPMRDIRAFNARSGQLGPFLNDARINVHLPSNGFTRVLTPVKP